METKKIGILLILIGLVLFVMQIPNLGWQYGLPVLSIAALIGYAFIRRSDFLLLAGLVCASLSAWLWFDLNGGLALALGGLSFILTWLFHTRKRLDHWPLIPGIIMILIGGSGFINATWDVEIDGRWIVLLLGVIFAVLYVRRREVGMLIPACILLAVGTFIIWLEAISPFMIFFALGTAFMAIFLIHTLWHRQSGWFWPLIPGGVLLTLGTVLTIGESLEGEQFVAVLLGAPGLILLAIYIWKRNLGLLTPGLMLASVAAWFALGPEQVGLLLALLSGSFLLIMFLETIRFEGTLARFWPLVPALVLGANAALFALGQEDWFSRIESFNTAFILMGIGLLFLLGKGRPQGKDQDQ